MSGLLPSCVSVPGNTLIGEFECEYKYDPFTAVNWARVLSGRKQRLLAMKEIIYINAIINFDH